MEVLRRIAVVVFLFVSLGEALAQTRENCDALIKEGIQEMNEKNHEKSLEILSQTKSMAEKNNWPKQLFLSVNNIGANYYLMLDYGEALDNYLEAYKIAVKELEPNFEMIVLNNIAILYSKEKKFDKAEEYFLNAYQIAEANKDSTKIGMYAVNLATVANEQKEISKSERYLNTAFAYLEPNSPILSQAFVSKAQFLVLKNELDAAEKLLDSILPGFQSATLSEPRISALMLSADIQQRKNEIQQAITTINKARFDPQASLEYRIDAFERLSNLYKMSQNFNVAFRYKDSLIAAKDSLNSIKNGKQFENSRIKFEIQNYQNELNESQNRLKTERKVFYSILAGIIFLILILFWALRNYWLKLKHKKIIAELELEKQKTDTILLEKELKEQSTLSSLEKEKLKNEIESKNRKLAAKAVSISTRNELIESILQSFSSQSDWQKNNLLRSQVNELKNYLKKESEWEDFFTHFEEVNQGFIRKLKVKHPELNSNDIRYLSYIYMNLSTKEISSLLNITVEACRKRKERIIKKMNLSEEHDLYSYLSGI